MRLAIGINMFLKKFTCLEKGDTLKTVPKMTMEEVETSSKVS